MSFFDRLGKLARFLTEQPNYKPVAEAGQRIPSAAYRPDTVQRTTPQNVGITRSNFASMADIAKNVPANPGGWNDSIETLRVGVSKIGKNITPNDLIGKGYEALDKSTDGALTKVLTASVKNLRSNYAWWRDIEANSSGMGLLAALGMIGAGVGTGALAATIGLPAFAVGGAVAVGAGIAGKVGREVSQEGVLGGTAQQAAELAITEEGQNKYNFGRDVVKSGAKLVGWEEAAKTDKGIGAITSGLLNIVFEFGMTPDIGAGKLVGGIGQRALKAPVKPVEGGLINRVLEGRNVKLTNQRIANETDLIKKTVAGEQTKWTPLFSLLENNTPAVVAQRPEFRTVLGNDAAAILAGRSREEIGLALRAGLGDKTALKELERNSMDLVNEINRLDGALQVSKSGGIYSLNFKDKVLAISPRFKDNRDAVQAEIDALRAKNRWIDDALKLDSQMQDRTVSPIAWVEKVKNDLAKERLARKTETTDLTKRETGFGDVMQTVYQKNPFSPLIRRVDRWMDDAPRNIVRFDDPLQSAERFRTGIRSATVAGAITPQDGVNLYNSFLSARSNGEKYLLVQEYTKKVATGVAKKNGVPPGSEVLKAVLDEYDKQVRKNILLPAYEAAAAGRGYMFGPDGINDILADPQLITQLANSAFLPDVKQWDKAFKRYAAKREGETDVPMSPAYAAIEAAEEFNVLWRGFTLLRGGYPANIIRDSTLRVYGDNALFDTIKELSQSTVEKLVRTDNSASAISSAIKGIGNPKRQEKKIANKILTFEASIRTTEKQLKDAGYDVKKPPKKIPKDPLVRENLKYLDQLKLSTAELRRQRDAIISGKISAPVGRDKTVRFYGEEFPAAFSGRFADITAQNISGTGDIIRALSSAQELAVNNVRKTRTGSSSLLATVDESLHMQEWVTTLRDILGFDPVARMYMEGATRKEIVKYLQSSKGFGYMDEMGLRGIDAGLQYNKIKAIVDMFAPTKDIHKLVLANQVTPASLTKLFPDPATRPPVLTDLVRDNSPAGGNLSEAYKKGRDAVRAGVAWLSTKPTAALMFNPYFAVKYNRKLQTMVHIANVQGRKLTLEDKARFEKTARNYAMREFREKLNSFHRDMNYGGVVNYLLAFFPAVVEQYRAYGRIALENPDFLVKATQIAMIPNQYLGAQEDSFGNEYVEVTLPLIGGPEGTTHRLPASWFNPFNPTGSPSIVSAGPGLAAIGNFVSKTMNVENAVTNWMLPFGTQEETGMLLLPNTIKRTGQAFRAQLLKSGPQLNKDTAKFLQQKRFDFIKEEGREPNGVELAELNEEAMADAVSLAWARARNSFLLPTQPQYVTPLQPYIDSLYKAREADPINGEDKWMEENPEYFLLARSLSDNTSGLIPDKTSRALVEKNPKFIRRLIGTLDVENASVLGAIFNDDNYAFSSAANAYLTSKKIPGTETFFKNSASALEAERSGVVNDGWKKYNKFIETVTVAIEELLPGRTAASGYGKILFDKYKEAYIEQQKVKNNVWWNEWDNLGSIKGASKRNATVQALTMAANDPELWKDLQKIPRWTNVVNYLNFRYSIYDELKRRKTTIDSPRAKDLRQDVDEFVYNLRRTDLNFGKFYDRYFARDTFDYVVEGNE